ncbi:MAG: peptidoglycan DD-metalloendopeptidase family protein [Patescibacteria group bacterium]
MRISAPKLLLFFIVPILSISVIWHAQADVIDDLKAKIDERNEVIKNLDLEIAQYEAQVEKTSTQGKTLKNKIATLELTRKKLLAEITSIQNQISVANLSINKLSGQISDAEKTIARDRAAIASTIVQTDEEESVSLAEMLLTYPSISHFLDRVESLSQLSVGLKIRLAEVRALKEDIEGKKVDTEGKRKELISLANNLSDKKKVAEYNKTETNKLLTQTKNQEASYRKILEEKQALRDAFAGELLGYESQLKIAIDPSSLPDTGKGVLAWPVDKVSITQNFGHTEFSKTTQAYNGQGHNGIDLKAAIGTKIKSSLSGMVLGTGNTDTACPNASYGRWVLVEHPNGLSTLYAHLSVIKVVAGQTVATGELLGYSGESGYATGPHLHFSVYASQGVKILTRPSRVCKATYTMPVGSLNSYLNPLLYL